MTDQAIDWQSLNFASVCLRFFLAALLGGIFGFERTRKMRAAGLRTYMLVCMGAAMAIMVGQFVLGGTGTGDVTRIAAQVVSGIGFIGAGTIMVTGYHRITGLTTAAGLWLCACLGLAIGCGFYYGALLMLAIALLAMVTGGRFQDYFISKSDKMRLFVLFEDGESVKRFLTSFRQGDMTVSDFDHIGNVGDCISAAFVVHLPRGRTHKEALELLGKQEGIVFLEEAL